jgi:hypothetical protein
MNRWKWTVTMNKTTELQNNEPITQYGYRHIRPINKGPAISSAPEHYIRYERLREIKKQLIFIGPSPVGKEHLSRQKCLIQNYIESHKSKFNLAKTLLQPYDSF